MKCELPLRIESVANKREHWAVKARRAKAHRQAALAIPRKMIITPPCVVTLIRVGKKQLDGDNLQGGFKALRDGIADRLGVDDADERVAWRYGQRIGKEYAVEIRIEPLGVCHDSSN